ncbi:MAG TPA: hypothetical protein PK772_08110 [Chitinophagaceae bacterium]|nr:hypothetical protein [Chitinophagaceae bacterium]
MKYTLTLFFTLIISSSIYAQSEKIKQIRSDYEETTAAINSCDDDPECTFYCNQFTINSNNKAWRAVGIYNKTIKFWYTDQPDMNTEGGAGKDGIGVLKKITITTKSTYTENLEYLFDDKGQLQFFYYTYAYNTQDPEKQEYRFYFSNNKLLYFTEKTDKSVKNKNYKKQSWLQILKDAKKYQTTFLNTI